MHVTHLGRSLDLTEIQQSSLFIPLFTDRVSAGFPSPAQDYVEQRLDLNQLCIKHPASTFFVRVEGHSMIEAGIFEGDILVFDRSIKPEHGDIVIASVYGETTVKELHLTPNLRLMPRNPAYQPIDIPEGCDLEINGVVTSVIRNYRSKSHQQK